MAQRRISFLTTPKVSLKETIDVNNFETTDMSHASRMPPMSSPFGTRLKEFRDARGWSQERVGFELEVSKATVSKWETGRAEPGLASLAKIRRLYASDGLSLDYLIDDTYATAKPRGEMRRYVGEGTRESAKMAQNPDEMALLTRFRAASPVRRRSFLNLLSDSA
ncbi:helix-turn-helix domain-containing protein [Luteimonas sp. XNQY3]|nr:helix-turn-helix transcriptional regulator [Luteimonas sp. XNQY3]MCD9007445.1 helix-turn-helix domain-containing protein [Luteimonas sp. XNQY3]